MQCEHSRIDLEMKAKLMLAKNLERKKEGKNIKAAS